MKSVKVNIKRSLAVLCAMLVLTVFSSGCGGHHSGRGGKGHPPSKEDMLARYDKDQDNRLSKEEFSGPDEHFTRFDANSDGYLDMDELPDGPPDDGGPAGGAGRG